MKVTDWLDRICQPRLFAKYHRGEIFENFPLAFVAGAGEAHLQKAVMAWQTMAPAQQAAEDAADVAPVAVPRRAPIVFLFVSIAFVRRFVRSSYAKGPRSFPEALNSNLVAR